MTKPYSRKKGQNTVFGVGINDADYPVVTEVAGRRIKCEFYARWANMLLRVYGKPTQKSIATATHPDWLVFSKFKSWMEQQDWEGNHLDKDILVKGNTEYRPDTCAFVPCRVNNILLSKNSRGGKYPIGVRRKEKSQSCINPLLKQYLGRVTSIDDEGISKEKGLGYFHTPLEAHSAWQLAKILEIEKTIKWYQAQKCFRTDIAEALMTRVWQLRLENANGQETLSL